MSAKSNPPASPDLADPEPRPAAVGLAAHRPKPLLSMRIDHDVLEWFRASGLGYQTRMNAVLRAYMEHARGDRG